MEAVYFFFCLSGFIFFWKYLEKLNQKQISARSFFILRFSRLYPLHLVTLLFVALFQYVFMELNGNFVVYKANDLKHFILNFFFISHWGFQDNWSFNAPVWSLSLEIVAYSAFFIFAAIGLNRIWQTIIVIYLSYLLARYSNDFSHVLLCFFIGGLAYLIYHLLVVKYTSIINTKYFLLPIAATIFLLSFSITAITDNHIKNYIVRALLFPTVILFLALLQYIKNGLGEKISILGDLTYSIYLLHFPLTLILVGIAQYKGYLFEFGTLFANLCFVIYFTMLIFTSHIVHKKFEVPAQKYIRDRFINKS